MVLIETHRTSLVGSWLGRARAYRLLLDRIDRLNQARHSLCATALPDEIRARALGEINQLLERLAPPPHLADEIKLVATTRGNEITIVERRAPWNPKFTSEWTEANIARLRYDITARTWTLRYRTANGRWHGYEGIGPARDLSALLAEIEADPTGIFWG